MHKLTVVTSFTGAEILTLFS